MYERIHEAENKGADAAALKEIIGNAAAKRGIFEGDTDNGLIEIGQVAAMIDRAMTAEEIICSMINEYDKTRIRLCEKK